MDLEPPPEREMNANEEARKKKAGKGIGKKLTLAQRKELRAKANKDKKKGKGRGKKRLASSDEDSSSDSEGHIDWDSKKKAKQIEDSGFDLMDIDTVSKQFDGMGVVENDMSDLVLKDGTMDPTHELYGYQTKGPVRIYKVDKAKRKYDTIIQGVQAEEKTPDVETFMTTAQICRALKKNFKTIVAAKKTAKHGEHILMAGDFREEAARVLHEWKIAKDTKISIRDYN